MISEQIYSPYCLKFSHSTDYTSSLTFGLILEYYYSRYFSIFWWSEIWLDLQMCPASCRSLQSSGWSWTRAGCSFCSCPTCSTLLWPPSWLVRQTSGRGSSRWLSWSSGSGPMGLLSLVWPIDKVSEWTWLSWGCWPADAQSNSRPFAHCPRSCSS